jgi:methyltransferase (TIGR00027 family)
LIPSTNGRVVGVRVFDDRVRDAVAAGCEQVVLLGAGLDTRAFRSSLPREVRLFEVDLPEMFAFKEPVLEAQAATPTCERRIVPAELRMD